MTKEVGTQRQFKMMPTTDEGVLLKQAAIEIAGAHVNVLVKPGMPDPAKNGNYVVPKDRELILVTLPDKKVFVLFMDKTHELRGIVADSSRAEVEGFFGT